MNKNTDEKKFEYTKVSKTEKTLSLSENNELMTLAMNGRWNRGAVKLDIRKCTFKPHNIGTDDDPKWESELRVGKGISLSLAEAKALYAVLPELIEELASLNTEPLDKVELTKKQLKSAEQFKADEIKRRRAEIQALKKAYKAK